MKEYALYKGDVLIDVGTVKEISKRQKVKERTLRFYGAPAYIKRTKNHKEKAGRRILYKIED